VYVIRNFAAALGGISLSNHKNGHYPAELRGMVVELHHHCKAYMQADDAKAWWQVLSTAALFFPIMALMMWLAPISYVAALLLAVPAGGLLTRFFALQHDCGHGSFFSNKRTNEIVGQVISMLTFTPYDHWRRSHAVHHAGSGNLERRGFGDVETITVSEFNALSRAGKWRYRIMRHPLVSLFIGPPLYFLVLQRLAVGSKMEKSESLPGIWIHNGALVLFYGGLCYVFGTLLVVSVVVPAVLVGAWIGGWLFFVQHQFEETLWEGADKWDVKIAALKGSSHLQLPRVLNWLTCDIGLHHIHHLSSRIPNYRLRACMAANQALQDIAPKLTIWRAMMSMHLALWDEQARRLISFREYHAKHA
jgi:acyl-lipid omega-6 desaturase (Delta-12 desaturase)